jgi:hypothetical protein
MSSITFKTDWVGGQNFGQTFETRIRCIAPDIKVQLQQLVRPFEFDPYGSTQA